MPVSSTQAETFLVNFLGFKNWKEVLDENKLEFLRVLIPYYAHHLYFQNISLSSIPPEERHVPSEDEIIAAGLTGIGGACITQNAFLSMLLKSLGFNSHLVSGFFHGPGNKPDNHVICVVEFSPEEKYMLDLGQGLPFAEPVPMHELPYIAKAAGWRYGYKKADNTTDLYHRVQLDGALYGTEYEDKNMEFVRYDFSMKPRTLEFFQNPLEIIFKDIDASIFLQHPFMFRYFEDDDDGNLLEQVNIKGNRKWILIRGVSVLIGSDDMRKATHYSSYDEVKDVIFKYFPKCCKEDVERSIQYFNDTVAKHGYFRA